MSTITNNVQTIVFANGSELANAIRSVAFCCDDTSTRFALGGVHLSISSNGCQVSATDGRRLAIAHCRVSIAERVELIIPASSARKLVAKLGKTNNPVAMELRIDPERFCAYGQLRFLFRNSRNKTIELEFQATEGRFPNVQAIEDVCIDENKPAIVGTVGQFRNWLETSSVSFTFENGQYVRNWNKPELEFLWDCSAEFDPQLLLPWLDTLGDSDNVELAIKDSSSAIMATASSGTVPIGSTFVFMPLG